jgi:glycosyltransferase involved in cell wall biosynthesis
MTHLYGSAVYGSIAGALTGTPVLSVLHGQTDVGARGRFTGLKARAVRYGAHRIVFVSQQLAADIRPRLGLSGERCIVVQNGIDLDDFQPGRGFELRRQLGLGADDILVGSVGNIRHPKGYDILLDAARIVCDRFERVHFAIVGEGSGLVYDSILAQRQRLGLNNRVHFLGFRSDINHLLTNFDVYALSSRTEGFSLACVEAMACGLAVVATRSGGPETIITHGESGLLVSPESAAELAAAIGKLAEDHRLRAALAEGGRRRATSAFSARPMLERYRQLILDLASD